MNKFVSVLKKISFGISSTLMTIKLFVSCLLKGFKTFPAELALIWDYNRGLQRYEKQKLEKSDEESV